MPEFRMPSLGPDMESGTLTKWYVKPGDAVKRGDVIAAVETDKANIEVESFESGVVQRLVANPGEKLPVGSVLAYIGGNGEPAAARTKASPAARKLARELGVDLSSIHGTGPHGIVERADVELAQPHEAAPAPPAAALPQAAPAPAAAMRRAIAAAMSRSNRDIPHYYLQTRIDMHAALEFLTQHNLQRPVQSRVLVAALLLKAAAKALTKVPHLNGYWNGDAPDFRESIHLGVAVSLRQGGLIVPAIHDADALTLDELMDALRDVISRARAGTLKSSDLTDSTITITNLGDLGVESVYGVIYPPQLALVGFGKIVDQPWARDGMLGVRPVLSATLAGDHRATDGHEGAQFLTALDDALQHPETL